MTETTVASVLDRLLTLAESAGRVAVERGPEAMASVGQFLQMRAVFDLCISTAGILVSCSIFAAVAHYFRKAWRARDYDVIFHVGLISAPFVALGIAMFAASLPSRDTLLSAWSPETALMVAAAQRIEGRAR